MLNPILKVKHFVFFILVYALPSLIQIFQVQTFTQRITENIENAEQVDAALLEMFYSMFAMLPIIAGIPIIVMTIWLIAVGTGLQEYQPEKLRKNTTIFVLMNFIGAGLSFYLVFKIINFTTYFFNNLLYQINSADLESFSPNLSELTTIPIFALVTLLVYMYLYYFTAKTIKIAETKKDLSFGDVIGEFFLIIFYPIGIWVLQPRINQVVESNEKTYKNEDGQVINELDEML